MEPNNGLPGGIFSGMGSGMLGLEMPLHQPQQQQQNPQNNPQNPQNPHPHHLHQPQMVAYDHHLQPQQSVKHSFPPYASTKHKHPSPLSDEDEPSNTFGGDDNTSDGKLKMSPWQRMKWTDTMVRLLIMAVYYIGDEAGSEGNSDPTGKKKIGGLLQKKGKWKSVSRAMMEKGYYVSPQQCEDKFNDLNKRYKRVNDILGKGTACKVVENQSLLETMDLSPKMKEEVRKLLNSKHLFFREMCAYHHSCGHATSGVASGASHSPEMATEQSHAQHLPQQQHQRCSHSSENAAQIGTNSHAETEGLKMVKRILGNEDEDESDDDDDHDSDGDEDNDDDEDDDDDEAIIEGNSRGQNKQEHGDEDEHDEKRSRKRPREGGLSLASTLMQQLKGELTSMIQEGGKSPWEKKQWMKLRLMQLEEQQVSYQRQAFELEKQRLKWVKFSSKKEREMERAKLENQRKRLENERMVLLVRQKELELLDLNHHQVSSYKRSDPSSVTG